VTSEAPSPAPQPETQSHPDDTAEGSETFYSLNLDVGENFAIPRLDPALRRVIDLGRSIDRRNAERARVAGLLGEVGRSAYALNRLDSRALAALSTLAGAAGSSKVAMREALAAAIAGDAGDAA